MDNGSHQVRLKLNTNGMVFNNFRKQKKRNLKRAIFFVRFVHQ